MFTRHETGDEMRVERSSTTICSRLAVLVLAGAFSTFAVADSLREAEALNHRGMEHLNKKEYDRAIELFREALKVHPDLPDILDNLGKALDGSERIRTNLSRCLMASSILWR